MMRFNLNFRDDSRVNRSTLMCTLDVQLSHDPSRRLPRNARQKGITRRFFFAQVVKLESNQKNYKEALLVVGKRE